MAYVALYRKWRPQDFNNLVGQEHISHTIANAIKTGRIAHAYLFSGPRGTGKTSTAKILAKALNCEHGPTPEPCNQCDNCRKINDGSSMDVFEIDAASNRGIDEMRDLRETVKFAPVDGRYKVYIIDEVHMLTTEAFNALLKTLEEPPPHVVFILATTEAHKVPATIHSRCQRYDFKRITVEEIEGRLKEVADNSAIEAEAEALRIIAVHADGGLRDALSILDQCSTLDDNVITGEKVRQLLGLVGHEKIELLADAMAEQRPSDILNIIDEMLSSGKAVMQILSELAEYLRNVMVYQATKSFNGLEDCGSKEAALVKCSQKLAYAKLSSLIGMLHTAMNECKWSPQPRITLETVLLEICSTKQVKAEAEPEASGELLGRIDELEARLAKMAQALKNMPARAVSIPQQTANSAGLAEDYNGAFEDTMDMAVPPPVHPAVSADNYAAVSSEDIPAIWKQLLEELKKNGQMSVHACVSQGRLQSYANGILTIAFKLPFLKARTERDDYRNMLEKILSKISGGQVSVRCSDDVPAAPVARPKVNRAKPPVDAMSPQEQHVVDEAVKMFGDNFVRKEDL